MSRLLHLAMLACAALNAAPAQSEVVRPTLDVSDMRVVVTYVSVAELMNLQAKFGANVDIRDLRQSHRHGFSILKTNRETGARTCEIYLPDSKRPAEVDDESTLILGHELLHCMLGNYHR